MSQEFNEMEHLERQIIKRYNELLKTLLEEGDMDTLERVITDDAYREELMSMHTGKLIKEHEKRWEGCYTFPLFVQCVIVLRASLRR